MKVLTVIFGGVDHQFLANFDCPHLKQAHWGPVVVDELCNQRDVATQITAQFITGKTWRDNGIYDRKKTTYEYTNSRVKFFEEKILRNLRLLNYKRRAFYQACGYLRCKQRNFLKADLKCPSLFEVVPNSKAVYVPAYNPEPQWALSRNILDPRQFPELGVAGAEDLLEKNFAWRKQRFFDALDQPPFDLLMGQFQFIDSCQHLYLVYHQPERMDLVQKCYERIDRLAGQIIDKARGRYDRILFVSDNGAARKEEWKPTHYNRPFFSTSWESGLLKPNLRDFFDQIVDWTQSPTENREENSRLASKFANQDSSTLAPLG